MRNQQQDNQAPYDFYKYEQKYQSKLLKGLTRDKVLSQLNKHPILQKQYIKNTQSIKQRIIDALMRQPSISDCPGFIYGFRQQCQYLKDPTPSKYDIKLGRTKRSKPQDRIFQWQQDDGHKYVEIFTIRTQFNNKLEKLVHLFFAYARKVKFVNGNRRIEWFTFQEKALNSTVTALINQLMGDVHHIAQIRQLLPVVISFDINHFCDDLRNHLLSIQPQRNKLILIGLNNSGKSTLKAMLCGQTLQIQQKSPANFLTPVFSIKFNEQTLKTFQNIIQLNNKNYFTPSKCQKINYLKQIFLVWSNIYNVETPPIPCLVVKFNDILCCEMLSFRHALKTFLQYVRVVHQAQREQENLNQHKKIQQYIELLKSFKLLLVVTQIDPRLISRNAQTQLQISRQQKVQFCKKLRSHLSNQPYFSPIQQSILSSCLIQAIPCAHESLSKTYPYEIDEFIHSVQNYKHIDKRVTFQYFSDQDFVRKYAREVVQGKYQQVGLALYGNFKDRYAQIAREINLSHLVQLSFQANQLLNDSFKTADQLIQRTQFLRKVQDLVIALKQSKKQKQVYYLFKQLIKKLRISKQDQIMLQLFIFCECISSSTSQQLKNKQDQQQKCQSVMITIYPYLSSSLVFQQICQRFQQVKLQIRDQYNYLIDNQIKKTFQSIIQAFYQSFNQNQQTQKIIFQEVYQVLHKIMNIQQLIQQNISKNINQQNKYSYYQAELLLQFVQQILEFAGGKSSIYYLQFRWFIQMIRFYYQIIHQNGIKLNSLISRLKQSIYQATKNKRKIQLVSVKQVQKSKQNKNDQSMNRNKKSNNTSLNSGYKVNNKADRIKAPKIILNKKNQQKNEILLKYIQSKQSEQRSFLLSHSILDTSNQQSFNVRTSQRIKERTQLKQKQSNVQIHIKQIVQKQSIKQSDQDYINLLSSDDQFYSMEHSSTDSNKQESYTKPHEQHKEEILSYNKPKQYAIVFNNKPKQDIIDFGPIVQKKYSQQNSFMHQNHNNSSFVSSSNNENICQQSYQQFVNKITRNLQHKSLKCGNLSQLLKSPFLQSPILNLNLTFTLQSCIIQSSIIIMSSKIYVLTQTELSFKIHYYHRRPMAIRVIIIAEEFQALHKLHLQDSRFGKLCMVKTNPKDQSYKVLDGYYTKDKRTAKKLDLLRIPQLVHLYHKHFKSNN